MINKRKVTKIERLFEEKYKIIVSLFFIVFLFIGIGIYKDYGLSWDEEASRETGILALDYIFKGDQELFKSGLAYHGQIFEIILIAVERVLNLSENLRAVFFMRHLLTFLLFYTGVFFFYLLCKYTYKSWKIGLLGSLFLILSPRIFAHSFYNAKDLGLMAVFIISIYTLISYLNNKTLSNAVIHAITCAFLINIRIMGIVVPFLTFIFFIADLLIPKSKKIKVKNVFTSFAVYIFFLGLFTIFFWPALWLNPFYHFIEAIKEMSRYPWDGAVLYLGNYIMAKNLPGHYIPVWILISTPLVYSICFFIGCFVNAKLLLKNPRQFYIAKRNEIIVISWFFLPLAAVIMLKSVLYDAWRHMFFIYPAFLMLGMTGLISLFKYIKMKFKGQNYKFINTVCIFIVVFNLVYVARFMIKYHPYQNVFFNMLVGRNMEKVKNRFELDYWGLSYRKALEYILKNDTDKVIKIAVVNAPGVYNAAILLPDDRKRLVYVNNLKEAKYFLSDFRWHREEYTSIPEYYSIKIGGVKIMVVYRLRQKPRNS